MRVCTTGHGRGDRTAAYAWGDAAEGEEGKDDAGKHTRKRGTHPGQRERQRGEGWSESTEKSTGGARPRRGRSGMISSVPAFRDRSLGRGEAARRDGPSGDDGLLRDGRIRGGGLDGDRGGFGSGWSRVCFLVQKGEGKRE